MKEKKKKPRSNVDSLFFSVSLSLRPLRILRSPGLEDVQGHVCVREGHEVQREQRELRDDRARS